MEKTLKIGVIGAGRIGRLHAANLTRAVPGAEVVAVSDICLEQAQSLAQTLGIGKACSDYREILRDPAVDAVFVCSSTDTHSEISIAAAQAGKHIFCEKPIDHGLEKIQAVLDAVNAAKVQYQVGFNRRFDRNFRRLRQAAEAGELGDIHIIKVTSRDPEAPPVSYIRVSGGIFLDMTIHDFDMVRYLSGSDVTEVSAYGACLVDPEIGRAGDIDTCVIMLKLANGALAVIDNSRQAVYGYDQRAEIFGSKGMIAAENERPNLTTLSTASGVRTEKPLHFFLERYNDAYIEEEKSFVQACLQGTPTAVSALDGLQPILIGLAAKRSYELGGVPVRVETPEGCKASNLEESK